MQLYRILTETAGVWVKYFTSKPLFPVFYIFRQNK